MLTMTMLASLRQALRAAGWSNARLVDHFQCSPSTIKRWLTGKGLALDKLVDLANLAGLTLADLTRGWDAPPTKLFSELTLAQEQALSEDRLLSFLFVLLLGGERWQDAEHDLGLAPARVEQALDRLHKLALIDRLPGGRCRPLIDRAILWRKSPMRSRFEQEMKQQFIDMDFGARHAVYASEMVKLSDVAAAELAELMEAYRRDIHQLAADDRAANRITRRWYGTLTAMRALDLGRLRTG